MRPHLIPYAEPRDAAEVIALARRVKQAARERAGQRFRGRREELIERGRREKQRVEALLTALGEARRALELERARAAGLERRVAELTAMIEAETCVLPGRQVGRIIIAAAEQFCGVSRLDIVSPRRDADAVTARHMVSAAMRDLTPLSLPSIGRALGGRDHTTVLHAVQSVRAGGARFARYPEFLDACRAALAAVGAAPEAP